MRKSRFLALFLTIVFVLANVTIPSFAENNTTRTAADIIGMGTFFAPIGDLPLHISHKVADEGATYALSKAVTGFSVGETDGILDITSAASVNTTSVYVTNAVDANVVITVPGADPVESPSITQIYSGYYEDFQDGVLNAYGAGQYGPLSTAANINEVTSDGVGNYYAIADPDNTSNTKGLLYFYIRNFFNNNKQATGIAPYVIEMDFKGLRSDIAWRNGSTVMPNFIMLDLDSKYYIESAWKTEGLADGSNFDFDNFNANDGKWHNYKWIITPAIDYTATFDLYIDDVMVVKGRSWTYTNSNSLNMRLTADGVDNIKRYGTSLGFAHDVTLTASNGNAVGSTLTATAFHATMPTSNIPESLDRGIYKLNTETNKYEKVSEAGQNTYTLKSDDIGATFKAGAFVKEDAYDYCESEVIFSENEVVAAAEATAVYTWGTKPSVNEPNVIWAPYGTETYDIPFTYSVERSTSDAEFTIKDADGNVVEGVTVVHDATTTNETTKKAILKIGRLASKYDTHYYSNSSTLVGDSTTSIALTISGTGLTDDTINVRQYRKNDFENGNINSFDDGAVQTENGNKYLNNAGEYRLRFRTLLSESASYQFKGVMAMDFDAKIDSSFKLKPATAAGNIVVEAMPDKPGYVREYYHTSNSPVYVGEGWQPVRIIFDFPNAKFSCFINNVPVFVDASLVRPTTTSTNASNINSGLYDLYYKGAMDNLGFSNVTVTTPAVYNAAIMNAAVDKAITLDYDFYCYGVAASANTTSVEYKIADAPDAATWTTLTGAPTAADLGKYVKAVITPSISYNGATVSGTPVETAAVCIGDVSVSSITVTRSGSSTAVKTFASVNGGFDGRVITEATSDNYTISLSVNASTSNSNGKTVKFILAQYGAIATGSGKLRLQGIASTDDVTLTGSEQTINVVTNYSTGTVPQATTFFKLFMLTSDGNLVPVNSVTNFR